MKRMLFFVASSFLSVICLSAFAQQGTFTYETNKQANIDRVDFENKSTLTVNRTANALPELKLSHSNQHMNKTILSDERVMIHAAYPSAQKAQLAIASHYCAGTGCDTRPYSVFIEQNGEITNYEIGNNPERITVILSKGVQPIQIQAEGVSAGIDEYGDEKFVTLVYLKDSGFVNPEMKPVYANLVGHSPSAYFSDIKARAKLLQQVSPSEFTKIRQSISAGMPNRLLAGRYLVISGCRAHACTQAYGAVVIDSFNDTVWWVRAEKGVKSTISHGASSQIDSEQANFLDQIVDCIEPFSGVFLHMNTKGLLELR